MITKQRRNTKLIGFSEEEYAEIKKLAAEIGVYPREAIMLKVRGK